MQQPVGHRMILYILDDGLIGFPVDGHVKKGDHRGVHDLHQLFFVGHEVDLFFTSVHHAGDVSLAAMTFGIFFPYVPAKGTAQ